MQGSGSGLGAIGFVVPALALAATAAARADSLPAPEPYRVPALECPVRIDGIPDEPCWDQALALELPYETRPGENTPAPVRTVCRFGYDPSSLLVSCSAEDPSPQAIRARLSDRDSAFSDDFVGIVIDTFNDERRAYEFFVNPLGVQMDLIQDDVGGREDSSWDAIWSSGGAITARGYDVELAIPFRSLSFQRTPIDQVWGLDIVRMWPRDHRVRIGLNPQDRNRNCYLCQASKIVGFTGAEPGNNLELVPTLTVTRSDELQAFPDGGLAAGETEAQPGITARWGVTPNLTLGGTVNPDFSQVEADVARLDINEEFALFFPEKRPFFLEGADFFETPVRTAYTRTVADPAWGAKISGKQGRGALGGYVARDEITNLLFPGSEGSALGSLDADYLTGVLRYRRDVGESSAIGALLTAREGESYHNAVLGIDGVIRPSQADTIRVQLLGSETRYPDSVVADFGQPAGSFGDFAGVLSYRHSTRNWNARASYADFGRDFRADSGFVPQVDYRQVIVGGAKVWQQDAGWYTRIAVGGDWDQTEDQAGQLIEREIEGFCEFSGPLQSFAYVGALQRERVFNEVSFDQRSWSGYGELSPWAWLFANLEWSHGDRIDFGYAPAPGVARQGRQTDVRPGITLKPGRRLRAALSHAFRRLDLDEGTLFTADLTELRLVWQFSVRAYVRLITQYENVERDPALYAYAVPARDRGLFNQLLFSYKINPQTALYAGYTDDRGDTGFDEQGLVVADDLVQTGRSFFFKVGYAWLP